MTHNRPPSCTMPMLDPRRAMYHIPLPNSLRFPPSIADPSLAMQNVEDLTVLVGVPGCTCSGGEGDGCSCCSLGGREGLDEDFAGEPG